VVVEQVGSCLSNVVVADDDVSEVTAYVELLSSRVSAHAVDAPLAPVAVSLSCLQVGRQQSSSVIRRLLYTSNAITFITAINTRQSTRRRFQCSVAEPKVTFTPAVDVGGKGHATQLLRKIFKDCISHLFSSSYLPSAKCIPYMILQLLYCIRK